jgi:hypothetical protein
MRLVAGVWQHLDDTPRCPAGAYLAVQAVALAAANGRWGR